MNHLHEKSIKSLAEGLKAGEFSSVELTQHFLNRIRRYDEKLNSFITVTDDLALEQAKAADQKLHRYRNNRENTHLPIMTGIPIALKDIFCTTHIRTSCGSRMLDNFYPPYDATLVERFHQANTVLLGKTNMDEFAMGSSNETSYYGPATNPWDITRTPGGSSGGSAAAVAARLCPGAMGTDTGGSIRQPSALCGITGLKPTYGRVSRYGMIAYASSLDQAGPMARSAEDIALLLQVIAGLDDKDSTSSAQRVPNYLEHLNKPLKGLKIGILEEHLDKLDPHFVKTVQDSANILKELGATIMPIHVPHAKLAIAAYYIIASAECSSNLARFDGVIYGHRCKDPKNLKDMYARTRGEGFGREVKRRMLLGTFILSRSLHETYYVKAQKARQLITQEYQKAFESADLILGPTTTTTAFKLGEDIQDPIKLYLADVYTIPANLGGFPCISIPAGFQNGLPLGIQLFGPHFSEKTLLNVAHQFQQMTHWHKQSPDMDQWTAKGAVKGVVANG